jgi:hypothetical protein
MTYEQQLKRLGQISKAASKVKQERKASQSARVSVEASTVGR